MMPRLFLGYTSLYSKNTPPTNGNLYSNKIPSSEAADGEVIHIPASPVERTFHGNITSYDGAGRFRLFIVAPIAYWKEQYDVCLERTRPKPITAINTAVWENDLRRVKEIVASAWVWMLIATDGRYSLRRTVRIFDDVNYLEALAQCDVYFSENDDTWPSDCVRGYGNTTLIEIMRPFWRGEASWFDPKGIFPWSGTKNCCSVGIAEVCSQPTSRVGQTLAHEWGHYEPGLSDEFYEVGGVTRNGCGISMMAGTDSSNYIRVLRL